MHLLSRRDTSVVLSVDRGVDLFGSIVGCYIVFLCICFFDSEYTECAYDEECACKYYHIKLVEATE